VINSLAQAELPLIIGDCALACQWNSQFWIRMWFWFCLITPFNETTNLLYSSGISTPAQGPLATNFSLRSSQNEKRNHSH
jgi:hypothetical protein